MKGCILNSRILWFFSNAYMTLGDESLLDYAEHAYRFLLDSCLDKEYGGVLWSVTYNGHPEDTTKHIYNQAFAIYALSTYYDASKDKQALSAAMELFRVIETKGFDEGGYKEALHRSFAPTDNDKLSENGVMADRTMNTLLHVFEAYTELFRVSGEAGVSRKLAWILDTFKDKIYNPALHRQEVFFDNDMNSIIDLHSYGHDIETAWLLDRGLNVLDDKQRKEAFARSSQIWWMRFIGRHIITIPSLMSASAVWWIKSAYGGYRRKPLWDFITSIRRSRPTGSIWKRLSVSGALLRPMSLMQKAVNGISPYHNGRMCMEIIHRMK